MELGSKRLCAALAGSLVLAQAIFAQQTNGITVDVNGQPVTFQSAQPQMIGDRVMIPLRGVLEQLGVNVTWNQATQTVTAANGTTTIVLHIGDSSAQVNGQSVALDQPAVLVNDSTMVPLRFMSQTFGASVQWDGGSQTVDIKLAGAQALNTETDQTTANMSTSAAVPLRLDDDLSGWTSNKAIHFTLAGQPGGQAVLEIPGLAQNLPMQETSPGQYEATWTPDPSNAVAVNEGSAVAKLSLNGMTYYSTAKNNIDVDTEPPMISATPQPNSTITGFQPEISVKLTDAGSGVDPSTVSLKVNNQDVTPNARITPTSVVYDLPADPTPGQYNVALSVSDKAGNVSIKTWSFSVSGNSISSNFVHTGRDTLTPGAQVQFTLKAPPGSQVTVFLGEGRQFDLAESQPGVFTGNYTVRRLDRFKGDFVTATITPPNGQSYTIRAPERMGISSDLAPSDMIPVISSPLASQTIADPLVIAGTAPPTSTVNIHVSYENIINSHQSIHGELADLVVGADSAGNFQSKPIHIKDWMMNGNIVYHIRASVTMPDGTESAFTEMRIHQTP